MIKRILPIAFTALVAVVLFASCSKKSNKQGRYIPATAGIVMHINGESLNSKLSWDEIKQNDVFKKMIADTSVSSFAKSIVENPENSGINIKADLIVFVVKDSLGGYSAFEGTIKDEAKFKTMLTNANKNVKETSKDGFTFLANEKMSVAYNKEKFIATINTPELNYMNQIPSMADTSFDVTTRAKSARDMNAINAGLLLLKEDASLANNEKFSGLMAEKGDAHFWFNAQYFVPTGALSGISAMANLTKLYDGAITTGTVNFENGKINVDLKSYGGKEITELYKKYNGSDFDKAMVKNIPSQNVAGLFAFNFKPEGIKEFLKLLNMDGLANLGAAQIGFNLDDFVKANKGDILVAVTDVKQDTSSLGGEGATFIFATSINDKPSFNKIIDAGKKYGGSMAGVDNKYAYNVNDKYFVFTNKKATTDTYLAGTANSSFSFMDKISGGPFGGYINFQYILNSLKPKTDADSLTKATYDASIKIWDNLLISGGNYKDGGITQHWEINLIDKNTNSLKQLNTYAGTIAAIQEKRKAAYNIDWTSEDVMAPTMDTAVMVTPTAPSKK